MTRPHEPEVGLRARKLRETRTRIQNEALDLIAEHGYEAVSVDEICARSGVSARTFFNYFGSKQTAVLGPVASAISDEQLREYSEQTQGDPVDDLFKVIARNIDASGESPATRQRRIRVVQSEPKLMAALAGRYEIWQSKYETAIAHRLTDGRASSVGEVAVAAQLVLAITTALLKYVLHSWQAADFTYEGMLDQLRRARQDAASILEPGRSSE